MPIVSISLTEEILREIDNLQKSMGFSGRSDAIRAGIRSFVSEEKQKEKAKKQVNSLLNNLKVLLKKLQDLENSVDNLYNFCYTKIYYVLIKCIYVIYIIICNSNGINKRYL